MNTTELPPAMVGALRGRLLTLVEVRRAQYATQRWEDWPAPIPAQLAQAPHPERYGTLYRFRDIDLPIYGPEWWPNDGKDRSSWWMASLTGREALAAVEEHAGAVAELAAGLLVDAARRCVSPALLAAVLARPQLSARWPWFVTTTTPTPSTPTTPPSAIDRALWSTFCLAYALKPPLNGELGIYAWPDEAGLAEVLNWLRAGGRIAEAEHAAVMEKAAASGGSYFETVQLKDGTTVDVRCAALLYAAELAVERDRARPAIALDAGKHHHALLAGLSNLDMEHDRDLRRVELFARGGAVQLALPNIPDLTLSEALLLQLRGMDDMGLRNWLALQRLFSVEGGRSGRIVWTLDGHLEALGYAPQERTRKDLRRKRAADVELLTTLELVVYESDGKVRDQRPLLLVEGRTKRDDGGEDWLTEAMVMTINPLLYGGVRAEDGTVGTYWMPAPIELAKVDHVRHPYTPILGAILPIRSRWKNGQPLILSGESLLALAGIPFRPGHPGAAWLKLERDLAELRRIGGLGGWTWRDGAPSLAGMCELTPPLWVQDRFIHKVKPKELTPGLQTLTGAELRELRKRNSWTQGELAQRLGVSQAKVSRAERMGSERLPADLVAQLRGLLG